ncbi:MAG: hypothetical protein E7629_04425 [Ruminococcaceae bacterium]|nr:hypothetical protein [Oscillospiraceae bacterium]
MQEVFPFPHTPIPFQELPQRKKEGHISCAPLNTARRENDVKQGMPNVQRFGELASLLKGDT